MPIQQPRRIAPIDLRGNVGIGISIPFNGRTGFNSTFTTTAQIRYNLINFLLTNRGERVMNPEFGADLRRFLFGQIDDLDIIKDYVTDRIHLYVPEVTIIKLDVLSEKDDHIVNIKLTYSVKAGALNNQDVIEINFDQ